MKLKKLTAALLTAAMAVSGLALPTAAAESQYSRGDVDLSGTLTSNDAALTLAYALNSGYSPTAEQFMLADADGDGVISADDAAAILQKVLTGAFPEEATTETTTEATTEASTEASTEITTEASTEATTEDTTTVLYELKRSDLSLSAATYSNQASYGAFTVLPSYKIGDTEVNLLGRDYAGHIQLNGTGSVSSACVVFSAPCEGTLEIVARSSNATEVRNLVAENSTGTVIGEFSMPTAADEAEINTVAIPSNGKYYIYGKKGNVNIYRLTFRGTGEVVTEESTEATTREVTTETTVETTTFNGDTSDGVVVDNFDDLVSALSVKGNKVYVKGTIMCSERIQLNTNNANVELYGLTNEDGTAATLDFAPLRDSASGASSSNSGFGMGGSYYTFKNLIIQNAGDCGIRITGNHNTFENCIFRYNNNSGVSVTSGGAYNVFRWVDSYRNGDLIQKNGADADGFSVKLSAGTDNYFYNCRAWENSDDGWDSYDRNTPYIGDVYYVECLAFNNGNPYVFTGEYDYNHGNALDKNLLYVQEILRQYPDFEASYNAGTVTDWPQVTVSLLGTSNTYSNIHSSSWAGNPNGFKFGSAATPSSSYRYIKNCIAFGHEATPNQPVAKGYDQNNGCAEYDIVNALSFDNVQNYWMDRMSANSMAGVFYSFGGSMDDAAGSLKLTAPSAEKEAAIRDEVNTKFGYILDMVYSDKIPGQVLFDVFN